ncbi:MAG: SAM-dependent chlorinase/fluorinase [Weeksellaceae bacterium]|nr:SAM-dependent chlorinase/fluorinase [Weeksellaceae bacterium]
MKIITLTTDFGTKDYAAASVKGAIYTQCPEAKVVDITHDISPFNLFEAAYIVRIAHQNFPPGTIHLVGVDAVPHPHKQLLVAQHANHYFICADNGILSLLFQDSNPDQLFEITINPSGMLTNFPTRDIMVPVACHLAKGGVMSIIGRPRTEFEKLNSLQPKITDNQNVIVGSVIYFDNFGNVITNINRKLFDRIGKGRAFSINVRNKSFDHLVNRYIDVVKDFNQESFYYGNGMALFNAAGFLEIALYKSDPNTSGSTKSLYGLNMGDNISINFSES